jgi:hypothetical protein
MGMKILYYDKFYEADPATDGASIPGRLEVLTADD